MEAGSLIQEALRYMEDHRDADECSELWIDAFVLESTGSAPRQVLLPQLARLASTVNDVFQEHRYPWHSGGEGPVFGVTVSDGIPHLRAVCRYGSSVEDEWAAVALAVHVSAWCTELIFQCWDREDGHLLLIEAAEALPSWVDRIGPSACRYRCWLVDGKVTLIRPQDALDRVGVMDAIGRIRSKAPGVQTPRKVQSFIDARISGLQDAIQAGDWSEYTHLAPLVLPRGVAVLLKIHPALANYAVHSFDRSIPTSASTPLVEWRDLVWTKHLFSRTAYAMLRSIITARWPNESFLPTAYQSAETDAMRQQKSSGRHLDHALPLGARLTAGLDYLVSCREEWKENSMSPKDRILKHWTAIDVACGGDGDWLQHSWNDGPNNSAVDLNAMISCPLVNLDLQPMVPFPLSSPGRNVGSLIRDEFDRQSYSAVGVFEFSEANDIDSESWLLMSEREMREMRLPTNKANAGSANPTTSDAPHHEGGTEMFDEVLESFQTFMSTKAEIEGVVSDQSDNNSQSNVPCDADPTVFMNLLHTALKSSPDELRELLVAAHGEPERRFDNGDDLAGNQELAWSMEAEFRSAVDAFVDDDDCDDIADEVRVVSNLLESMDLSGGASGPVRNILSEIRGSRLDSSRAEIGHLD